MALQWLCMEKNIFGMKTVSTWVNRAQCPGTVLSKTLFWLGGGWHCCRAGQAIALKVTLWVTPFMETLPCYHASYFQHGAAAVLPPSGSPSEKALCPHLLPPLPAHGFPELCRFFCVCQDRGSGTAGGRTGERIFCSVKWQLLSDREELVCRILVGKYVGFLSQWTNSGTRSR